MAEKPTTIEVRDKAQIKGVELMMRALDTRMGEFAADARIVKLTETRPDCDPKDTYIICPDGNVPTEPQSVDRPGLRRERRIYGPAVPLQPGQADPIMEMWGIVTEALADESLGEAERTSILSDRLQRFASGIPHVQN